MADTDSKPYGIIYCITNLVNGKRYIGQTTMPLMHRWRSHCGATGCKAMRSAIEKYGRDAFEVHQIDAAYSAEELDQKECLYIESFGTMEHGKGYNLKTGGGSGRPSELSKQRMSDAKRGFIMNPATKEKISLALKGVPKTEAHSAKVSAAKRGKPNSEQHRINQSKPRPDFVMSESHKAAIRQANAVKIYSEETRKKISEAHKGRKTGPLSEATKAKLSQANKGTTRTPEQRQRMSEGRKAAHAARLLAAQI